MKKNGVPLKHKAKEQKLAEQSEQIKKVQTTISEKLRNLRHEMRAVSGDIDTDPGIYRPFAVVKK